MEKFILLFLLATITMTTQSKDLGGAPYDGERFDNLEPVPDKPLGKFL